MKAIMIAMILAIVSTPAFARNGHHKHVRHHHGHVFAADAQPSFGSGAMAAGWDAQARVQYSSSVARHASAHGVPPELVHRVIMRESRYNPRAVSKGNYGMMQIRLGTAKSGDGGVWSHHRRVRKA